MTESPWEGSGPSRLPRWVLWAAALTVVAAVVLVQRPEVASPRIPIGPPPPAQPEAAPALRLQQLDATLPAVARSTSCPPQEPVAVAGGRIYPPTFPAPPAQTPDGCFADIGSALEQRFRLAPAPPGYVEAAGLYLADVSDVDELCLDAAQALAHAVACPSKLPHGGALTGCPEGCVEGGGFVLHLRSFALPSRWCRRCVSELVVASAPVDGPADALALTTCRGVKHGDTPVLVRCQRTDGPADYEPHAGHILRRAVRDGIAYAVSVEGLRFDGDEVVNAIFESVGLAGS